MVDWKFGTRADEHGGGAHQNTGVPKIRTPQRLASIFSLAGLLLARVISASWGDSLLAGAVWDFAKGFRGF